MAYAPTLTATVDTSPSPRVLVEFTSVAPTCSTINVQRTQEGRTYQVRGGVNLFAVGGVAIEDLECGFGVPLSYRAEMFTSAGVSLGFTDAATVTVTIPSGFPTAWISQPLQPTLAVPCKVFNTTSQSLVRVSPGQTVYPEGATVGTWIGSQRQGLQNLQLAFRIDPADADEFLSMFGSYSSDLPAVVCLRTNPPARLPRTLFIAPTAQSASMPGPVETDQNNFTFITYLFPVDEVAPPSPALVIPLLRWEDVDAAYPTWAAMDAAYATWYAQQTDYSLAGYAG